MHDYVFNILHGGPEIFAKYLIELKKLKTKKRTNRLLQMNSTVWRQCCEEGNGRGKFKSTYVDILRNEIISISLIAGNICF